MKSKSAIVTLSFLFGSTGATRFYLGQNQAGWATLLVLWVVIPAIIYAVLKFNLFPNHEPFLFARLAIPIFYNVFETIRFLIMKPEKFKSQDRSIRNTVPLTLISIILAVLLNISAMKAIAAVEHVDITKVEPEIVLSSAQMSAEFRADEGAYRKKYDNKVLQIEGIINETGEDLADGQYIALEGNSGDVFGIKCYFEPQNTAELSTVKMGDLIIIKGVGNGNKLENCKIMSVNKDQSPSQK